jgi:putative FmdB family regulatory protein
MRPTHLEQSSEEAFMPTYDYRCRECGHEFELVERMSEHQTPHKCPKCGSDKVEPVLTQFYAKTSRKS